MIHLLGLFLLTLSANSETIHTQIFGMDIPDQMGDPVLVLLSAGGKVAKLDLHQARLFDELKDTLKKKSWVNIELNPDRFILTIQRAVPDHEVSIKYHMDEIPYEPTVIPDLGVAAEYFKELNANYRRRSQCYNRAHIWSYELFEKRNVNSMKVFLFFTRKYIREYDWSWWFHVSPYVMVRNEKGEIQERVMDYMFLKGPALMRDWTDYFMKSKTECPVVTKYSDYENHEEDSYCYLAKVPMYYWVPRDLETMEQKGPYKTEFIDSEVGAAYRQGF